MGRFKISAFLLAFSFTAFTGVQCHGQQGPKAVFQAVEWNFGPVREVDGPVAHVFNFTNKGSRDIVVTRVSASCGCTATKYDPSPVKPKCSASIEVRFDPRDFSGPTRKSVSVAVSDGKEQQFIQLYVSAEVIPRPRTIEDEYPLALDDGLRVSGLHVPFGYMENGTVRTDTIKLINNSENDIRLSTEHTAGAKFLKADVPSIMKPGEKSLMTVTYDLRAADPVYGMVSDRIFLIINGRQSNLPVNVNAIVVDDFSRVDKETAPKLLMDPVFHNFGETGVGERLSKEIIITNAGSTPLIIRSVSARRNTESDLKEGAVIKPGGNITVTISMTVPKDAYGVISGGIAIISNDPERPMREFRAAAEVRE